MYFGQNQTKIFEESLLQRGGPNTATTYYNNLGGKQNTKHLTKKTKSKKLNKILISLNFQLFQQKKSLDFLQQKILQNPLKAIRLKSLLKLS